MNFDPMTGEPISEETESKSEIVGFDPMTGEPIRKAVEPEQEMVGFDPMTGEPIGKVTEPEQNIVGFDPMTGEPISEATEPKQKMGGFDPMTGKPLGGQQEFVGYDAKTENTKIENTKTGKKNKLPVIIGAAAVIVVVIVGVCLIINLGLFSGKAGKVTLAINNTFKDKPHFVETLEQLSILEKDKFTVSVSGEIDDMKIKGEVRSSNNEKQVSVELNCEDYPKVEVLGSLDPKTVKVQIPVLSKNVFVYNYKKENTGYLMDMLDYDDIELLNKALEEVAQGTDTATNISKDIQKVLEKEFKKLKFDNAEKEEFTVDDKDVNCKGYVATITGNNVISVVNGIEDIISDNAGSLFDSDTLDTEELAEGFEEIREECEDMEDIEVTFYIYKNMLAAVVLESEEMDEELELCFEGGDYRMQNMELKSGSHRIQLKGEDSGSKEEFTLKERYGSNSNELASLEYNYDSGKFSLDIDGDSVSGKLQKSGSGLTLKINEINTYYERLSPNIEITITDGAKMQKFSGKEFDLGNADEDDFMDMAEDIEDELYDSELYYLLEELY